MIHDPFLLVDVTCGGSRAGVNHGGVRPLGGTLHQELYFLLGACQALSQALEQLDAPCIVAERILELKVTTLEGANPT